MTFTDEQMDEYAQWAATVAEPTFDREETVPAEYAHLTPSEQAEAVDADNAEEFREARALLHLR